MRGFLLRVSGCSVQVPWFAGFPAQFAAEGRRKVPGILGGAADRRRCCESGGLGIARRSALLSPFVLLTLPNRRRQNGREDGKLRTAHTGKVSPKAGGISNSALRGASWHIAEQQPVVRTIRTRRATAVSFAVMRARVRGGFLSAETWYGLLRRW